MSPLGWLLVSVVTAYACAAVAPFLRLRLRNRLAILGSWCFVLVMFAIPLIVPAPNRGLRAISATVSTDLFFRMVDFFRQWNRVDRSVVLREYYRFLIPFPVFSVVYPLHRRRRSQPANPWPDVGRIVGGTTGTIVAVVGLKVLSDAPAVRSNFALNHVVMLVAFVVAIESISRALYGIEHLAGFDTTPIVRNAYLSRTVAEFWQRYNYRIHDWLYRNVFRPGGGHRTPIRALLMTFFISGLLHEVAFTIATSRLTGYQLAFFSIQAPAALASGCLQRLAKNQGLTGKILAHGSTIAFMTLSSVLFFEGVSLIFPFIYASRSPLP